MLVRRGESGLYLPAPGIQVARVFPATLGPAFSPSDISGMIFWIDADAITPQGDNTDLTTWEDLSANNYDFSQSTADAKPHYRTSVQNGKPGIQFDGGDDVMNSASMSVSSGPLTLFIVCNPDSASGTTSYFQDIQSDRRIFAQHTSTDGQIGYYDGGSWRDIAAATANAQVLCYKVQTSGGELFRDGTSIGTGVYSEGSISSQTEMGAGGYAGYVFEQIMYDSILSTGDQDSVETYLGDRWGISIS